MIDRALLDKVVREEATSLAEDMRRQKANFPRSAQEVLSEWLTNRQSLNNVIGLIQISYRRKLYRQTLTNRVAKILRLGEGFAKDA